MPSTTATPFFTNAAGTVQADPTGYARLRYHATAWQLADLAALYSHLTALLRQRDWDKVLVDSRELTIFPEEAKDWIRTTWLPKEATQLPRLLIATLLPASVFSRLAISQMQLETTTMSSHRNFMDEAAAIAYLAAQPATGQPGRE